MDVRERSFIAEFPKLFRKLKAQAGLKPTLIFLEASDSALVRRFSAAPALQPALPW